MDTKLTPTVKNCAALTRTRHVAACRWKWPPRFTGTCESNVRKSVWNAGFCLYSRKVAPCLWGGVHDCKCTEYRLFPERYLRN